MPLKNIHQMTKFNYLGNPISGKKKLISLQYGTYDENGEPNPYWTEPNEFVDGDGFDKTYKGTHGYWDEIFLPKSTIIARYGNIRGQLTTDVGTPYESLGLPYDPFTVEYHEYEVIADNVRVKCQVKKGKVYPMFGSNDGAIQYLHEEPIRDELAKGKIKEVFKWKEENKSV